ncbi:MAG: hypothetical protein R3344_04100, partial [Acidobacteriota bacterium]|nr:hypothetical protein [Acidobacteriota bacterium]
MGRRAADAVLVMVVALLAAPALAVSVRSWDAATGEAFDKGTLDGTQIDGRGHVLLSPEFETLWGPEEGLVWAVAPDGSGGAFVGQSGPGRVVHVSPGGEATVWHDLGDEGLVTALASDGAGGVFVGTSPEGRVLHVRGPDDTATLVETGSEFVWALAVVLPMSVLALWWLGSIPAEHHPEVGRVVFGNIPD